MIFGNLDLMQSAWDLKNEPFSIELIRDLHRVGTKTLEQEKYTSGSFRTTDDVAVVNAEGEIVHQPPKYDDIERLLTRVVKWLNSNGNRAIDEFISVYERAAHRMQELEERYSGLGDIEKKIIGFVSGEPRYRKKPTVTAREVESLLGISYNSAKQKLDDMVSAGILQCEKVGKSTEYFLV